MIEAGNFRRQVKRISVNEWHKKYFHATFLQKPSEQLKQFGQVR